jgi:hypothetical protein
MTGAKTKIAIKLKRDGVYVNYAAKVGDYMSIEGYTIGGRHEVKQIIRRALRAEKPLPNHIKEIVAAVVRQVLLWTDVYKVWGATAGMIVDVGVYSYISIYATLRYDVAELTAVLDGFDGFTHAQHGITRLVQLFQVATAPRSTATVKQPKSSEITHDQCAGRAATEKPNRRLKSPLPLA